MESDLSLPADHVALMAALGSCRGISGRRSRSHLADLPIAEVAALVGAAQGTVKARLSRGRAALAALLDDREEAPRA